MKEAIKLTAKEIYAELSLRNKGKAGEWDIPTTMLRQWAILNVAGMEMSFVRNKSD